MTIGAASWYRFRATFHRRWAGCFGLLVLIGILGGASLASFAAARRTESAYPAFLARTNPSDLNIDIGDYNPVILNQIRKLPQVRSLESYVAINRGPVARGGDLDAAAPDSSLQVAGSVDGLYFNQDKVTIVHGRMADPTVADEVIVNNIAAQLYGIRVGQVLPYGFFSNAQLGPDGLPTSPARTIINLRVVGIGYLNNEVIEDQVDKVPVLLATPALAREMLGCCVTYAWSGLQLRGGSSDVAAVEREYLALLPPGDPYYIHVTSVIESEAEQAVYPESIALAVLGAIAAATTLVVGAQAISRQLRLTTDDRQVMRALGASPALIMTEGLIGVLIATVGGVLMAGAIAVALSPIGLGPVSAVQPSAGFSIDWTAVGFGMLGFVVVLSAVAVFVSYLSASHRSTDRPAWTTFRSSSSRGAAAVARLPVVMASGIRFALDPGRGRSTVPVRSTITGVVLAVTLVAAAVTFGDSLNTLVSHPRLYGWNWNYMLESGAGYGDIPQGQAARLLGRDPDVTGWTGVYFDSLLIDGQAIPVIGGTPGAMVAPPLLQGHRVETADQVVLGPQTMDQLHKHIGDTVRVSSGSGSATLTVVGVASMPTVGIGFGLHLSIGSGAVVDYNLIPAGARNITGLPTPGPNAIFIRANPRIAPATALRSVQEIAAAINTATDGSAAILVYSDLLPAEIINYKTMGAIPLILASGLASGAALALGLTLTSAVRRRRHDLALFKAFGFTRRQLAGVVACQAAVTAAIGVVVGLPLGVAFGRTLWNVFARKLYVVPAPAVPIPTIILVGLGAIVLSVLVAAAPGRSAAHTSTRLLARVG